jgi:hypothetical protein
VSTRLFGIPLLFLALGAAACSAGGGGKLDASFDIALDFLWGDLPEGCPPGVANDKNVGAPCTRNGNQCNDGMYCTCDMLLGVEPPADTPCLCTQVRFLTCDNLAINEPGFCGQNATCCGYMNTGSLCVPNACLGEMMCPMIGAP